MIEHVTRLFKRGHCCESSFELRAVDRCHVKSQTWTELCAARLKCTENNVMRISLIENNSQLVVNLMTYILCTLRVCTKLLFNKINYNRLSYRRVQVCIVYYKLLYTLY